MLGSVSNKNKPPDLYCISTITCTRLQYYQPSAVRGWVLMAKIEILSRPEVMFMARYDPRQITLILVDGSD